MLLGLTYQLIRFLTDLVLVRTRSDAQLRAEVLALRHQLRVLGRKVGKPAWQPGDRLLLAAISRFLPRSGLSALLVRPETLLRLHRGLVRRRWAVFRQRLRACGVNLCRTPPSVNSIKRPRCTRGVSLPGDLGG